MATKWLRATPALLSKVYVPNLNKNTDKFYLEEKIKVHQIIDNLN